MSQNSTPRCPLATLSKSLSNASSSRPSLRWTLRAPPLTPRRTGPNFNVLMSSIEYIAPAANSNVLPSSRPRANPDAVSGRVNDLKKDGLIELSGKKKDVNTNKDVQVVVPVDEVDGMQKDAEGKIKLLLTMYGYKDIVFRTHEFKRSLVVGYFEPIQEGDIARVSNNTLNILEEMSVWDDDAGRKYWYIIKDQEL